MNPKMQIKNEGGQADEPPGSNITDTDNSSQSINNVVTCQKRNSKMGLFSRICNLASLVCNGIVLPAVAVFIPQSNIFLALG
jgi:hypothetical protein